MGRVSDKKRIAGRFVHLPLSVMLTAEFSSLNHAAVRLLLLIAAGYTGHNNGRLVACRRALARFGWNSADSTTRCLRELEDSGLIVLTRMGCRPNRASWYALGWRPLDVATEIEIDPRKYRVFSGTPICPAIGQGVRRIAPLVGQRKSPPSPAAGAMQAETPHAFVRSPERI
jgi:hypothetical protein